ncbi:MAG: FAD-dependent oxidoreductase [Pseudomonadota bacterium]
MMHPQITIVGAGVAGLCLARSLLQRRVPVALYDHGDLSKTASWAAAGMLAPTYEAATDSPSHPDLFTLLEAARDQWDRFSKDLAKGARDVGLAHNASVALALTQGQASVFRRLEKHGRARRLSDEDSDRLGRVRSEAFHAAFWLHRDGQVDNRALIAWLMRDVQAAGGQVFHGPVPETGLDPETLDADCVVDARGWRSPGMTPVKGTALSLAPHPGLPKTVVRWGHTYLVPKADRVVLGAHTMAGLTDTSVDPAIARELLDDAAEIFPAVRDTDVLETWSGIRPRSADGAPVLGWAGQGRYQLGGLYRDGILLAPVLAEWATSEILGEAIPELAKSFSLSRFVASKPALAR